MDRWGHCFPSADGISRWGLFTGPWLRGVCISWLCRAPRYPILSLGDSVSVQNQWVAGLTQHFVEDGGGDSTRKVPHPRYLFWWSPWSLTVSGVLGPAPTASQKPKWANFFQPQLQWVEVGHGRNMHTWQTRQMRTFLFFSFLESWLLSIYQQSIAFNGWSILFLVCSECFLPLLVNSYPYLLSFYPQPSSLVSQLISYQFIVKFIISNYILQIKKNI